MAEFGSKEAGKKGGKARAKKLSPEERAAIARQGAIARWGDKLPAVSHGDPEHPLRIGGIEIPCYVLDDGTRVITHRGLQGALGMAISGGARETARFLEVFDSNGFDCKDLIARVSNPVEFRPKIGGRTAFGYEATVLADFCELLLEARKRKDFLNARGLAIASRCEVLMCGFARVGIVALIDEATGYQYDRARRALEEILEQFIKDQLGKWAKRFPDEFYRHLFRLRGVDWPSGKNPPQYVGRLTNNLVYERLAPGVLQELQKKTPKTPRGHRRSKFRQWLTEDVGHPKLQEHLSAVIAIMRICDDWNQFKKFLDKSLPKFGEMPLFDGKEMKLLPDLRHTQPSAD